MSLGTTQDRGRNSLGTTRRFGAREIVGSSTFPLRAAQRSIHMSFGTTEERCRNSLGTTRRFDAGDNIGSCALAFRAGHVLAPGHP